MDGSPDTSLMELVREAILIRDLKGRLIWWNSACAQLYGHDLDTVKGCDVHELLASRHPDGLDAIEKSLIGSGRWQGEITRKSRADDSIVAEGRWIVRRDKHGTPFEIVEVNCDIRHDRASEAALRLAEHRYTNIFQAMAASFWELDFVAVYIMLEQLREIGVVDLRAYFEQNPDFVREMIRQTRVIDVNEQSVLLFGRGNKNEMLASLEPYWPEESIGVFAESVLAALDRKPHFTAETRLAALDGRIHEVLFTASFPPDLLNNGRILVGIIDVSSAQRARREVEASARRYRELFHFMPVSLMQFDRAELAEVFERLHADGVEDLGAYIDSDPTFVARSMEQIHILEVNERAAELFGVPSPDALLGTVSRLWSEDPITFRVGMEARYAGALRFERETRIKTEDGRVVDVLYVTDFPEGWRGDAMGVAAFVDLSDRARAEEELARVRAEFAHAARIATLGELTATIAHEVSQPLAAIAANSAAGLRWLDRPVPDLKEARTLMRRSVADAERAADIIRRIRGMASGSSPQRTRLMINDTVGESVAFLRFELQRHKVQVKLLLDRGNPEVIADRVQLQQVLVNLSVNAIQAMEEMSPSERFLSFRSRRSNGTVILQIEDSGPGFPEDQLERLFESFYSTKSDGLGIGLSICRSIIESHGGKVWAINRSEGHGAVISIELSAA